MEPTAADEAATFTEAQLKAFILASTKDAIAPAVAEALKPAMEKHSGAIAELLEQKKAAESENVEMGKYPLGRKLRAVALAHIEGVSLKDADGIASVTAKHWPVSYASSIKNWAARVKTSLSAGVSTTAGDMVMPEYDPEWIELLRSTPSIRQIARTMPMPRGASSRRKQTDAATAYYQGELDRMTPSNLTVGRVPLSYKKLTALSVVTNDLLRFSSGEADRIVQEDFLRVVALREDRAFLLGNPPVDAGSPQGVRYQTNITNVYASAGVTLANIQADFTKAIRLVEEGDVPVDASSGYWIMSPATKWVIYALATTTGDWMFANELNAGRLFGFKVISTTQLSVSKSWIGANAGLVFFVHAPALEIHDSMQRTVEVFRGGAYYDPALAAVASGISNDETVITCIAEHDFLQVYDKGASVITGYAT